MNSRSVLVSSMAFLRRQKWLVFLLQQGGVFLFSLGFLMTVKMLTGKDIRGGKDAMGIVEYLGMVALFTAIIALSMGFYYFSEGKNAPRLGIKPTPSGIAHLAVGTIAAFLLSGATKLFAIAGGTMTVTDTIGAHFSTIGAFLMLILGLFSLTYNSVMEEVSSRAVPLMIFRRHSILFRIFVPALFFAALHLAAEPFRISSFYEHVLAGAVFAAAYLLTRNIWLASGVHTGMNLGVIFDSGRWQMGAFIKAEGTPPGAEWLGMVIWSVLLLLGIWQLYRRRRADEVLTDFPENEIDTSAATANPA